MSHGDPTAGGLLRGPPESSPDDARCGDRRPSPADGGGASGEAGWHALATRLSAERRRLAEGEAIDLAGAPDTLRALLAAAPPAAIAGPAGLALRDELEQLVAELGRAVEASGRELVELDQKLRALGAYAARA